MAPAPPLPLMARATLVLSVAEVVIPLTFDWSSVCHDFSQRSKDYGNRSLA
jgi:hypothetical protein